MYSTIQTKILEFIDSIKNKDELQLTSVNCGIFAILLNRIFNVGKFVGIVRDLEPDMVYHIMLKFNDKYYDSQGEWKEEEFIEMCQKVNGSSIELSEDQIEKLTEPNMDVVELVTKLKF